ncbi:hypothetical protein BC629DRAFT_78835 [Irpex lacteus]|nr:hypothetical protein BC629DRAFT_78835 [Irpex lacteus]
MSSNEAYFGPILPVPHDQILSMSKPQLMQVALKHSLSAGFFIDTKIYAFSRRRLDGTVDKPRPIYANSALLRANSFYFDSLFDTGFVESRPTSLRGPFPEGRQNFTSEYDYDSDSDLEDEDTGHSDHGFGDARPSSSESLAIDEVFQHQSSIAVANQATGEQSGRVIVIPDIAFSTLKAAIFYLCTGELNFAALRSSSLARPDTTVESAWQAPPCSPKSMYRLADKLSLMDLKDTAMANFVSQLTTTTIVQELRSSFTSLCV